MALIQDEPCLHATDLSDFQNSRTHLLQRAQGIGVDFDLVDAGLSALAAVNDVVINQQDQGVEAPSGGLSAA